MKTKQLRIYNADNEIIGSQTVSENISKEQIAKKIAFVFGKCKFFVHYKLTDK